MTLCDRTFLLSNGSFLRCSLPATRQVEVVMKDRSSKEMVFIVRYRCQYCARKDFEKFRGRCNVASLLTNKYLVGQDRWTSSI